MKKTSPKVLILTVLSLILAVAFTAPALAASYFNTVIAFGDSLSDHYGLSSYLGVYDPVNNPNGVPESWTNGDVWVEYLADDLNAGLINYAIGGAMTRGHENNDIQAMIDAGTLPPLGLVGQVDRFVDKELEFNPDTTLFTVWIGGNDLLEFGRGESAATTPQELISNAVGNIVSSLFALGSYGAKYILILNLPDVGKSPAYANSSAQEKAGATALTQGFNGGLAQGLDSFRLLFPNATLITYDEYTAFNELVGSDTFANVTGTYLTLDQNGEPTGGTNGPAENFLFWDLIHPTTRAHEILADDVRTELFDMGFQVAPGGDHDSSTCFIDSLGLVSNW